MRTTEKTKEIINHCVEVHGEENAKEQALNTIEQIIYLAPIEERAYWHKVKQLLNK
jgi:hypothetical protein